jgi:hypothetical protein
MTGLWRGNDRLGFQLLAYCRERAKRLLSRGWVDDCQGLTGVRYHKMNTRESSAIETSKSVMSESKVNR